VNNMTAGTTLVIGTNFWNHDASIFCIDIEGKRAFGMSTERVTRFKHDTLPPVAILHELVRQWQINPLNVGRLIVATNLSYFMGGAVAPDLHDQIVTRRAADGARFKGGTKATAAGLAKSGRWRQLARMLGARASLRWGRFRSGRPQSDVSFEQMVGAEFSRIFPDATVEVICFDHHLTHAAGALVLSGLEDPLLLTIDGFGDGFFSKAYVCGNSELREVSASPAIDVRDSEARASLETFVSLQAAETGIFEDMTLGHFYSIFTWLLGFEPVSDEGKLEALAAYAKPDPGLLEALRRTVRLDAENARLVVCRDEACALYYDVPRMRAYLERLGPEVMAASMQRLLEQRVVELASCLLDRFPRNALVLSGGCAANVILNMRIFEDVCPRLYIAPAMADDGTALGAAVLAMRKIGVSEAAFDFLHSVPVPYYGSEHLRSESLRALSNASKWVVFEDSSANWPERAAAFIFGGEVGAVYQGRMEWGPRALGNRSILANACTASTRDRLNAIVKKRPLFQPFCPAIMEEERERLFEHSYLNLHMTCAFRMRDEFLEDLPSAVHVDGTARAQFVRAADNPGLHRVLSEFKRLSGFGVLINTSFNLHGRTMVNTPEDAIEDFLDSKLDFLVLDGYLARKR
jgi:carbamoyltransferase